MTTCAVPDCDRPVSYCGWCKAHYQRVLRHGDPLYGGQFRTAKGRAETFFKETVLSWTTNECLIWPYTKSRGYGQLGKQPVHRLICEVVHGPAPSDKHQAAHSCGHRDCCNHHHVRWATRTENEADKLSHGTRIRGERHSFAKLTETKVQQIRQLRGQKLRREIAAEFGVAPCTVSEIHHKKKWAWLD